MTLVLQCLFQCYIHHRARMLWQSGIAVPWVSDKKKQLCDHLFESMYVLWLQKCKGIIGRMIPGTFYGERNCLAQILTRQGCWSSFSTMLMYTLLLCPVQNRFWDCTMYLTCCGSGCQKLKLWGASTGIVTFWEPGGFDGAQNVKKNKKMVPF